MKITAFHAGDGDCLLLSSGDDPAHHILVDGGRKGAFDKDARKLLGKMREDEQELDVIYVSHIDNDHISGVLRVMEDEVEWRVHEFRKAQAEAAGDPAPRKPRRPRPPEVGEIWHNGLFVLVGEDAAPEVEAVLAATASVLVGSPNARLADLGSQLQDLATGEESSMELSRRISDQQLGIPLNPRSDGPIMKRGAEGDDRAEENFSIGGLEFFLLGPSDDDLEALRDEWQKWIDKNNSALTDLQGDMLDDEERLGNLSPAIVANPLIDAALGEGVDDVSEPNVASLMFLVEEDGHTLLLTGDGVTAEILEGLEHHGKLDADDRIHVSVLKVQHHGALANVEKEFVMQVTADHYVFCGNGAHDNPEKEVVEAFANARLDGLEGEDSVGPDTDFKFWFTSGPETPDGSDSQDRKTHMTMIAETVGDLEASSGGRMTSEFLKEGHFEIELGD